MLQRDFSVVITGLGGQGILTLSKCLAAAACRDYPFVSRTENRGLSQRGGSVSAAVRFGMRPLAPYVGQNSSDVLLALDSLEAARSLNCLKESGIALTHVVATPPAHLYASWEQENRVHSEQAQFNNTVGAAIHLWNHLYEVDLQPHTRAAISTRSLNLTMLGAASAILPLSIKHLKSSIRRVLKPHRLSESFKAFEHGRQVAAEIGLLPVMSGLKPVLINGVNVWRN